MELMSAALGDYQSVMQRLICCALSFFLATFTTCADSVDDFVQEQMSAYDVPGVALKIISRGKEKKNASYGLANVELGVLVSTNSVFEIGSLTKQFTAAC